MTQPTSETLQTELDWLQSYLAALPKTEYVTADRRAVGTPEGVHLATNEVIVVPWTYPQVQRAGYVSVLALKVQRYKAMLDQGRHA